MSEEKSVGVLNCSVMVDAASGEPGPRDGELASGGNGSLRGRELCRGGNDGGSRVCDVGLLTVISL